MISGISGTQGYQPLKPVNTRQPDGQNAQGLAEARDTVNINPAVNMSDEEARSLLREVSADIESRQAEALNAHQGLDYNRVMALIGDI